MNRIDAKFRELRAKGKKAFIAYITAGDPNIKVTGELAVSLAESGVDIIELGIPFSDPLADGPTIQAASQRALCSGVTVRQILAAVSHSRQRTQIPLALMTYYNPVFHFGEERFLKQAKAAGVDGLIIPDLPPEEGGPLIRLCRQLDIATIFFIAPTTTDARKRKVIAASTGFIYYVSLAGVTGERKALPPRLLADLQQVKGLTDKPVCVGFGISTAGQVAGLARVADGVIVGSAIVKEIERNSGRRDLVKNVSAFVRCLLGGM